MIATVLRVFGYAKVPPEAVQLIYTARKTWEERPHDPTVGAALVELEKLMRSTQ